MRGFFPLDEELALLPGGLTPTLVEHLVRLGTWLPFRPAARELAAFTQVTVSEATVRRQTEAAGAAYGASQTAAVAALERAMPPAPAGPALQQVSVDGAMVLLVGGDWAEVKTLAIGTVGDPVQEREESLVHTSDLSYCSRLADHETFARLATVETHRRGTETAGRVVAVLDGAEWAQGFVDLHRPDAIRVLDWGHASSYVVAAGQAVFGEGTAAVSAWLARHLDALRHGDQAQVLTELRRLRDQLTPAGAADPVPAAHGVVTTSLAYLEKRRDQIRYAEFAALGYPIGSGAVESANTLVVQARLKGAGMHWAREQVKPMVALRTIVCRDRWADGWAALSTQVRQDRQARRRCRPAGAASGPGRADAPASVRTRGRRRAAADDAAAHPRAHRTAAPARGPDAATPGDRAPLAANPDQFRTRRNRPPAGAKH